MAAARPRGGIQALLARLRDRLGAAAAAAGRRALVAARGETAQRLGRLAALTMALAVLVVVLYDHGDVPTAAARGGSGQAGVAAGADGVPGGAGRAAPGQAAPGREGPAGSGRSGPEGAGSAADPARPGAGRGDAAASGGGEAARSGGSGDAATAGGRGDAAGGGRAATGAAGERAPAKLKRPAKPAEVAAAWYAARHRLPRSRVRPLQQDRVSARQVRVLVLAEAANGRLRTALVRVRLGPGGWEVR
jgi:hypothetical protein